MSHRPSPVRTSTATRLPSGEIFGHAKYPVSRALGPHDPAFRDAPPTSARSSPRRFTPTRLKLLAPITGCGAAITGCGEGSLQPASAFVAGEAICLTAANPPAPSAATPTAIMSQRRRVSDTGDSGASLGGADTSSGA